MSGTLALTITVGVGPGGDDDCAQVAFLAAVREVLEANPAFVERYADSLVGFVVPQTMNGNSDSYRSPWRVPKAVTL